MGTSRLTLFAPLRLAAVAIALSLGVATQAQAAGTHTVTGEALADDQTFTYRLLDQFPRSTRSSTRTSPDSTSFATSSRAC